MPRHISHATEVDQTPRKRWTAIVQVLECYHTQQSKHGINYKRIILTDPQGMKLTALIFSDHLDHYASVFKQYRRYYISNAVVIQNDPKYSVSCYAYSWVLNKNTLVEEFQERISPILPCVFQFTEFSKLHKYAESENLQNIRGIVLQCLPSYEQGVELVTRRDIIVINEEKALLVITLWNQFDEHEGSILQATKEPSLIFGMRLKVTTFNSISLTTRQGSGFLINPPVREELRLHNWYTNNKREIEEILRLKDYNKNELLLPYPPDDNITSIEAVTAAFNTVKTAWVTGKLSLPSQQRNFSYTGCVNCHKALEADVTWIVTCPSCKMESEIEPMTRATVVINDGTASIEAVMNTPDIEKFIPFNAAEVKHCEDAGISFHSDIAAAIQSVQIVAFIRLYEIRFRGTMEMRISIVKAYNVNEKPFGRTGVPTSDNLTDAIPSSSTTKNSPSNVLLVTPPPVMTNKESNVEVDNTTLPSNKIHLLQVVQSSLPEKDLPASVPLTRPITSTVVKESIPLADDKSFLPITNQTSNVISSTSGEKSSTSIEPITVTKKMITSPTVIDTRPNKKSK